MDAKEIKEFARKHAPEMAQNITELCGHVIAKGMTGILEQCAEMQLRSKALEAALCELVDLKDMKSEAGYNVGDYLARKGPAWDRARELLRHNAELSGPRPLAAEGSRSNDVLGTGGQ